MVGQRDPRVLGRHNKNGENTFIRGWEGEFPKPTCSGLSGSNRGCNCKGSAALKSSYSSCLVSSYVNMAQWSSETQHLVVGGQQCLHYLSPSAFQNGIEG